MENERPSLSDILSDEKPAPEAPAAPDPAPPPEAAADEAGKAAAEEQRKEDYKSKRTKARDKEAIAQGKVRDPDTGQFVARKDVPQETSKEEPAKEAAKPEAAAPAAPAATAPQQQFTPKELALLRAAQEERRKRQEVEQRLAAMDAAKPKEPAKTFWDDPEAALAAHKNELHQAVLGTRLSTSEAIARSRHQDFDEKVAIFAELAASTPGLGQQMISAPDPAEFVYRTAANHKAIQEAGGVDALLTKREEETRAKVRAELEAEYKAKADALAKDRAALPPSLSDARAAGGGAAKQVWGGPPSMADILK